MPSEVNIKVPLWQVGAFSSHASIAFIYFNIVNLASLAKFSYFCQIKQKCILSGPDKKTRLPVVKIVDLIVDVHTNGHYSASCSNKECNAYFAALWIVVTQYIK